MSSLVYFPGCLSQAILKPTLGHPTLAESDVTTSLCLRFAKRINPARADQERVP